MQTTLEALQEEFDMLTRRHANARDKIEPLRAKREEFNQQAIAAQAEADKITEQMQAIYEESKFFEIAERRGKLATAIQSLK